MQGMTCEYPEVRQMLNILSKMLVESTSQLSALEQANVVYGLINSVKFGHDDTEYVIAYLLFDITNNITTYPLFSLLNIYRSLSLLLFNNSSELSPFMVTYLHHSLALLDVAIADHRDHAFSDDISGLLVQYGLQSEKKVGDLVKKYLDHCYPDVLFSRNEVLHGFEADIVLRLPGNVEGDGICQLINIEVDGPQHQFPKKKLFTCRRDALLVQQYGYQICRLDITQYSRSEGDLGAAVTEMLDGIFK
jgi:hypothetical protein